MRKLNFIFIGLVSMFLLFAVVLVMLINGLALSFRDLKQKYQEPDTTITYRNGKYDTVIIKKSLPTYLK